jgi:hypothetical protein
VALLVTGLTLLVVGDQLYHPLRRLVHNLLTVPDGEGAAGPAGPVSSLASGLDLSLSTAFTWSAAVLALLGSILLGWALLQCRVTEYAITMSPRFGGRITKVRGIINRQTVAVPLAMVNDLVVHEPLLGRILGWGHIDIEAGNDYQGDRLDYVPNPRRFYEIWTTWLANADRAHRLGTWTSTMHGHTGEQPGDGTVVTKV